MSEDLPVGYVAALTVPEGYTLTSVRDLHYGEPTEHLEVPGRTFVDAVQPGRLLIRGTREPGAEPGSLTADLRSYGGRELAGSGSYPIP